VPMHCAQGARPRLFLAKEGQKSAVSSITATRRGRLHCQQPTFQAQSCRQSCLQLNYDNHILTYTARCTLSTFHL
jgi:hypothetical protein